MSTVRACFSTAVTYGATRLTRAGEAALRQGVDRDSHRLAGAHTRRVDLVERRLDVQAGVVDQVDRRRRRHAGRRRRRVLADLADDLGHRAVERRATTVRRCSTRVTLTRACAWRTSAFAAAQPARRASASARALSSPALDTKPWSRSAAWRCASRSAAAALVHASPARLRAVSSCASASVCCACWSSFHSFISSWPFLTRSPSLTANTSMRPPDDRRQLRALACLDGAGTRVGDRRLDLAARIAVTTTGTGLPRPNQAAAATRRPGRRARSGRGAAKVCGGADSSSTRPGATPILPAAALGRHEGLHNLSVTG